MWSLFLFGDNVEDRIGHIRFFIFYLLCGISAAMTHVYLNRDVIVPTIGASGAIAGIMGAYFVLFPRSRIIVMVPILFYPLFFEIPALFYLFIWFLTQVYSGSFSLAAAEPSTGGIAFWAHAGGFIAGILLLLFFLPDRKKIHRRSYPDEYYPW